MKRIFCILMSIFVITVMLTGCGDTQNIEMDSLEGKRVAVLGNSSSVMYAEMYGADIRICSDKDELRNAVKLGDVECAIVDERDASAVTRFKFGIKTLKEPLLSMQLRIAAARENPDLIEDINDALYYLSEEKILDNIIDGYYSDKNFIFEAKDVSENAKTLTVAVCIQDGIYCYRNDNGDLCGIDVDISKAICSYLNLKCEFIVIEQAELIQAVWSGTSHFAIGCLTDTTENAEICIMSEPYAVCTQLALVD